LQQTALKEYSRQEVVRPAWWVIWAARLPYLLFMFWMVYKQRLALRATGIAPGPAMLAATVGSLLFLLPWAFIRPGRKQIVMAAVLDFFLTLLVYGDILYFRQFGDLTSVANLRFAGQLSSVADSVTVLMQPEDLWQWLDVPLLLLLALVPIQAAEAAFGRFWHHVRATSIPLKAAALIAAGGVLMVTVTVYADPLMSAKYYGHSNAASRLGLLSYHAYDVGAYADRMAVRVLPSGGSRSEVKSWFDQNRRNPSGPASPLAGIAKGKNVIIIQVESLQAFPVGLKVGGEEVTPNLNRLAQESMHFTDFYTQTGQGVTSDADLLANCSLHPTRTGAVYYDYAANDFRCMPTLLREHGYHAYAMQGMPPDFWNLATVYPHVGFERYFNLKDGFNLDEKIGIGLSDESFFKQAIPKLKSLPEPFYAFLVTLTSHGPFDFEGLPQELKLDPSLAGTQFGHYLEAVHYTDAAIGHFVDQLKAEGLLDKSVLMLYGDHAGVFRTSTGMHELLGIPENDEVALTRMEKRIPFLVRLPNGAQAGERTVPIGEADIAPTLAGLLGVSTDTAWFMGRDILRQPSGPVAFYTGSALDDTHLFWPKESGPECYDRTSGALVDTGACQGLADQATRQLEISRLMVERNLIPDLMKIKQK
jgi:lipoteichoic acid synthase